MASNHRILLTSYGDRHPRFDYSTICFGAPMIVDNSRNPLLEFERSDEDPWDHSPVMRSTIPPILFSGYGMPSNTRNSGFLGINNFQPQSFAPEKQHSKFSQEEQSRAALRKTVYDPIPKKITKRLSMYYKNKSKVEPEKDDEDSRRCTVCLEDFNPKEMVMLTPCDHMFHEDCILPWLKSNKQCPVCRFTLISNPAGPTTSSDAENHGTRNNDLSWFILAIEDALVRRNNFLTRY